MNKIVITIALCSCFLSASGQTTVRDTIYIYETVTVYDTIRVSDTVRIKKTPAMQSMKSIDVDAKYFSSTAATIYKNGIIPNEGNHEDYFMENHKLIIKEKEDMKFNVASFLSGVILTAQTMSGLSAQETQPEEELKRYPMQFGFVYPMTMQGAETVNYSYSLSFSAISGKVGSVSGIGFAGLFNEVLQDSKGVQFGGLTNKARNVYGVQFAGLNNVAKTVKGIQFAGLGNITEDIYGIQFAGISNITEKAYGVQFAGIANISKEMTGGIQFAGVANLTDKSEGLKFAGVTNISQEISGVSFSGVVNRTGILRGVQFAGIVNVIDTIESGIPIAPINIVKKGGYREWSVSTADYLNAAASLKMGIPKFYTILTLGANFMEDKLWASGFGFGTRTVINQRFDFQPEIVSYQYYPHIFKNIREATSNHFKLGLIYKIHDRFGLVVAPSIYHFSNDATDHAAMTISPLPSFFGFEHNWKYRDHTSGERISKTTRHSFGAGISIGILFN